MDRLRTLLSMPGTPDTNVLSEPLRREPDLNVLAWLAGNADSAAITSVSVDELLVGVRRLPRGRRREGLLAGIERSFTEFAWKVLAYDAVAARSYAELQEARTAAGRPLSVEDGMIAAICRKHKAQLATRNAKDFEGLGIAVINPWALDH